MGTATGQAPKVVEQWANIPAQAAGSTYEAAAFKAPFTGVVASASIVSATLMTGTDSDSRTVTVYNRGAAGAGTTAIATKAFVSGTNAAALDETTITLATTTTQLDVNMGDIVSIKSSCVSGGLAQPAMMARITFSKD